MAKRLNQEFVSDFFKEQGCKLLGSYQNNSIPLLFLCYCGKEDRRTYANFKKRSHCTSCGLEQANKKRRIDPKFVFDFFKEHGCELLDEYKNNYTPLRYRCSCGRVSQIRYFAFKKGQRCEMCDGCRGKLHYNWNPNRDEVEYNKKFKSRQSHLLQACLKSLGKSKRYKAEKYLGYSTSDLKNHIMNHLNWENVKDGDWHIDHIFPIKAFLDYRIDDVKLINCLENLQPLASAVNLSKNAKYDKKEFEEWLLKNDQLLSIITHENIIRI